MSDAVGASNPFATRFTRPGAIEFLFPEGVTAASLVEALRQNDWHGEIVGPHGTGKSTLLAALRPHLEATGRKVVPATLRAGERSLPQELDDWRTWNGNTQVIVDGYEQLSWWSRRTLAWRVGGRKAGLLVTSHQPTGLATIFQDVPSLDAATTIVRRLAPDPQMVSSDDIEQAFRACQGNLREMLFQLYDLYERRTR